MILSVVSCWKKVEHTEGPHLQFLEDKRRKYNLEQLFCNLDLLLICPMLNLIFDK